MFTAWIYVLISWGKKGFQIPKWVHYTAFAAEITAIILCIVFFFLGSYVWFHLLWFPFPAVYLIWLWSYCPDFGRSKPGCRKP
jgi:hypothetical protein